ncbi:MAG: hypothetical protein P1U88_00980 [Thalassobaculaceae bacterium]|nr:hypothetical protein [Thalassobaculaceae bacterium]
MPPAIGIAASILLTSAGMHMLRLRRLDPPGPYTLSVTAFCLTASVFLPGLTWEWPGGVAVWIGLVGLAGMLTAFWPPSARPVGTEVGRTRDGRREDRRDAKVLRSFAPLAAVSGILLGGAAAAALALAMAAWLPLAPLERGFLAIVLWPLLWAAALLWLYASRRAGFPALSALTLALAAGASVWLAFQGLALPGAPDAP